MAWTDALVIRQLLRGQSRRGSLAERLQAFYGPQACQYDAFRERLLHGRHELLRLLAPSAGDDIVELGAGTGRNLFFIGEGLRDLGSVERVDLCPALLEQARQRTRQLPNVRVVEADAETYRPARPVDRVYFSYSLTMIPDWRRAADNAPAMLKPGGVLGVVDFYVSDATPQPGETAHSALTRLMWPSLFAHDGVYLTPEHPRRLRELLLNTSFWSDARRCRTFLAFAYLTIYSSVELKKEAPMPKVHSILLSDIHLGTHACQAKRLLDFLREYDCDNLFLVGDIVDFWAMKRSMNWSTAQNTVVQKILKRARHGVDVVYVSGNDDEVLREHVGTSFGHIRLVHEHMHTAADGKRYLVIHGDEFDQITKYHRWLAVIGDRAYSILVRVNALISWIRRSVGVPGYWSFAGYAKRKVKRALEYIFHFEHAVAHYVKQYGVDGVICGHIHCAAIKQVGRVTYINCGDGVDSCTAIVEQLDGRMELIERG